MKKTKQILFIFISAVLSSAQATPLFISELNEQSIYAGTYVDVYAGSGVGGNLQSLTYVTAGDSAKIGGSLETGTHVSLGASGSVGGNIKSGTYINAGDSGAFGGDVESGTYTSIGKLGKVTGNIISGDYTYAGVQSVLSGNVRAQGAVRIDTSGHIDGDVVSATSISFLGGAGTTPGSIRGSNSVDNTMDRFVSHRVNDQDGAITSAQQVLRLLGNKEGKELDGRVTTNKTLYSGVYNISGTLAVTANSIITLDGQNKDAYWIFNVSDFMSFGSGVKINLVNVTDKSSVIWNSVGDMTGGSAGYATIGANSDVVGLILAKGVVTSGAGTNLSGVGGYCGGAFSARSFVSLGANNQFGAVGCKSGAATNFNNLIAVPEPNNVLLLGMSLLGLGYLVKRRKKHTSNN